MRKEHIIGIFLDLSKAFDTIDHKILINKLSYYGVRGIILSWFNDYLSNRKQYVNFRSNNSSKSDITCGVPQGSILGPLLFLIYIKEHIIGIFLDLSKAFDTIDHKILINKLSYYGVRGIILSWFNDYLSNRKQYVNFRSNNSSKSDITCGVPQGSILGPLFF